MEGARQWAFTAPAFASQGGPGAHAHAAEASYCPAGWKKRRRRGGKQPGGKRHKRPANATAPLPTPPVADLPAAPVNPAQLAPLRCSWPHPAVVDLVMRQCWPAAGAAALGILWPAAADALAPQHLSRRPSWWNGMLPSLSLLHAPLEMEQQALLGIGGGGSSSSGSPQAEQLPQPNVLVGYEVGRPALSCRFYTCTHFYSPCLAQHTAPLLVQDDWLEVAPEVLPLWQATPLAPFSGPKPLLHYLVCPAQQLAEAEQFIKVGGQVGRRVDSCVAAVCTCLWWGFDTPALGAWGACITMSTPGPGLACLPVCLQDVGSLIETCNLGSHRPADASPVHSFQLQAPPGSTTASEGLPLAAHYLPCLRQACEQLQRQLLLDPPEELQQQGASLEHGAEPAVLVYVACPLERASEQVAALLEAAACLAPCTLLGATAGPGGDLDLACSEHQALAPGEPQPPDRPAGATPMADSSRAAGGSPPLDEALEEGEAAQQQGQQGEQQGKEQRYHGAAHVLHQQERGDFRQLPLRMVQRPERSRPLNIVLQVG